jgi:hypothetical protein
VAVVWQFYLLAPTGPSLEGRLTGPAGGGMVTVRAQVGMVLAAVGDACACVVDEAELIQVAVVSGGW